MKRKDSGLLKKIKGKWVAVIVSGGIVLGSAGVLANTDVMAQVNSAAVSMMSTINSTNFDNKDAYINDSAVQEEAAASFDKITAVWSFNSVEEVKAEIARQEAAGLDVYVVQWGDTLSVLAEALGTTVEDLANQNNISNWNLILTGDLLTGVLNTSADQAVDYSPGQSSEAKAQATSSEDIVQPTSSDTQPADDPSMAEAGYSQDLVKQPLNEALINATQGSSEDNIEKTEFFKVVEDIKFGTEFRPTEDLALGEQRVIQEGEDGLSVGYYAKVTYKDGRVEESEIVESETESKAAVNRIVEVGTRVDEEPDTEVDGGQGTDQETGGTVTGDTQETEPESPVTNDVQETETPAVDDSKEIDPSESDDDAESNIEVQTAELTEAIPFDTVTVETEDLLVGETEVQQEGVDGERVTTYQVTFENGVEVDREKTSEEVTVESVDEVVLVGTAEEPSASDEELEEPSDDVIDDTVIDQVPVESDSADQDAQEEESQETSEENSDEDGQDDAEADLDEDSQDDLEADLDENGQDDAEADLDEDGQDDAETDSDEVNQDDAEVDQSEDSQEETADDSVEDSDETDLETPREDASVEDDSGETDEDSSSADLDEDQSFEEVDQPTENQPADQSTESSKDQTADDSEDNQPETKQVTRLERRNIPFEVVSRDNDQVDQGQEKLVQVGENGILEVTIVDTLVDGEVVSSQEVSEEVVKEPVNQIVEHGTRMVTTEREAVREVIKPGTERRANPNLNQGQERVVQEGQEGLWEVIYEVTYVNGEETSRVRTNERQVLEASQPQIVEYGTRQAPANTGQRVDNIHYTTSSHQSLDSLAQQFGTTADQIRRDNNLSAGTTTVAAGTGLVINNAVAEPMDIPQSYDNRQVVMIDAGHGGTDPGATAFGRTEKALNFEMSQRLAEELLSRGYEVQMIRNGDITVNNLNRSRTANASDADIYISIHQNAAPGNVQGIETFYYRYDSNYQSAINRDYHNDPQRVANSKHLASLVQDELIGETGAVNRGVKRATFQVLRETDIPAILIEGGFMDHQGEATKLASPAYQERLMNAVADAVDQYFADVHGQ